MLQHEGVNEPSEPRQRTIAASRTRPWLAAGWGCRGRRLSRGRRNPDRRLWLWRCRLAWHRRDRGEGELKETSDRVIASQNSKLNSATAAEQLPCVPVESVDILASGVA